MEENKIVPGQLYILQLKFNLQCYIRTLSLSAGRAHRHLVVLDTFYIALL